MKLVVHFKDKRVWTFSLDNWEYLAEPSWLVLRQKRYYRAIFIPSESIDFCELREAEKEEEQEKKAQQR